MKESLITNFRHIETWPQTICFKFNTDRITCIPVSSFHSDFMLIIFKCNTISILIFNKIIAMSKKKQYTGHRLKLICCIDCCKKCVKDLWIFSVLCVLPSVCTHQRERVCTQTSIWKIKVVSKIITYLCRWKILLYKNATSENKWMKHVFI